MKRLIGRHTDTLVGMAATTPLIAIAYWILPPVNLPYREIFMVIAILISAYTALKAAEWLEGRESKLSNWVRKACMVFGASIIACALLAGFAFVIWAKFTASPSACMQCD